MIFPPSQGKLALCTVWGGGALGQCLPSERKVGKVTFLSSTGAKFSSMLILDSRLVFSTGLINVARGHSELAEPGQHLFWLRVSLSRHGNRNVNDKNIKVTGLCETIGLSQASETSGHYGGNA